MPRNASGIYTLPAGNPVVSGTTIESTWANTTMSDVANELTNSIDKGGRTSPTANLPMNGFKHTGAAAATALPAGQYLVYGQDNVVLVGLTLTSLAVGTVSGITSLAGSPGFTISGGPNFTESPTVPTNPDQTGGSAAASQAYVETAATRAAAAVIQTINANANALSILVFLGA